MSAQRPVRHAMFTISSRKALCLAERACPHGHVVACLPSLSRAAPHSVPSRFLFLHRLPWPHTGLHNRNLAACWKAELCTIGVLEVGSWRNPEAPGPLALSRATWCLLLEPMWSRRSLVALLTRESARARCEVAVDPSLVKSLGSSTASRLMAWSLDRADLNPGISAVRSSMPPNPILAVTLAAHEAQLAIMAGSAWSSAEASPKPPSRIGMKSCFACATVKSPTPRMAW